MTKWIRKRIGNALVAFTCYGTTVIILDLTDTPTDWRVGLAIITVTLVIAIVLDELWPEQE